MKLSFRERLIKFIVQYIDDHNKSPNFSEIIVALGISPHSKSLITRSLRILEKEGKLRLTKEGRYVSITLRHINKIPLLGSISAGCPIEAIPDQNYFEIGQVFQANDQFALRVKGISMIDEGIVDGDIILCSQTTVAKEGDVVVALIDQDNVTLKRISYKVSGLITLVPANKEFKPRAYLPERIRIQGIYTGLIRTNY